LDVQLSYDGLVVSGVEHQARGTPEKQGMLVMDASKGHLTPEIKPQLLVLS
jgi:hypothetical protein